MRRTITMPISATPAGIRNRCVPSGGWPQMGSVVSKIAGSAVRGIPPFVSLCYRCTHGPYNEPGPGFLGVGQTPFGGLGSDRGDMVLQGVTPAQLGDRKTLLVSMDRLRRERDASGAMGAMDQFSRQAFDVLTSSRLIDALDLSKEDPRLVARYGQGDETLHMDGNGAPRVPPKFALGLGDWSKRVAASSRSTIASGTGTAALVIRSSSGNWKTSRCSTTPWRRLSTTCTTVAWIKTSRWIAWGEFGRTPKISKQVGRDHWPRVSCALMAGGGMKTGQVIGATDRLGGEAVERPVTFGEVFATLYHNLGLDLRRAALTDLNGRPQYLIDGSAQPIRELI